MNCGNPVPPNDGYLGDYSHTREGATVTFQCNNGYRPSAVMISICTSTALWIPAPEILNCTLITGNTNFVALSISFLYFYIYKKNLSICVAVSGRKKCFTIRH